MRKRVGESNAPDTGIVTMSNTSCPKHDTTNQFPSWKTGPFFVIVLFLGLWGWGWGLSGVAFGDMYRYVDQGGTLNVTNVPTDRRYKKLEFNYTYLGPMASREELEEVIAWYADKYYLDPNLIRAVIKAESGFDPLALSKKGARGLMQLMPKTAALMEVRDPYNPVENIGGGARYLRYLLDKFDGKITLVLAAYNAGETRVRQYQKVPPFQETRHYVKKVMRYYKEYRIKDPYVNRSSR